MCSVSLKRLERVGSRTQIFTTDFMVCLLISKMKGLFVFLIILEHKLCVWLDAHLVFISLELFTQRVLLH